MNDEERLWLDRIKEAIRQLVAKDQDLAKQMGRDKSENPILRPVLKRMRRGRSSKRPDGVTSKEWAKTYRQDYRYCLYHGQKIGVSPLEYANSKGITLGAGYRNRVSVTPPHDAGMGSDGLPVVQSEVPEVADGGK